MRESGFRAGAVAPAFLRTIAGVGGAFLAAYGVAGLRRGEGRGAAATIVIAAAALYFAFSGRAPTWFLR